MRYSLMLLPLAGLGLAGCVVSDGPSSQRTSTTYMTPERSATYMTPEQSATLTTVPGDPTSVVQTRYLPTNPLNANTSLNDDSRPPDALWPRQ
jgi:hypothetical protein